MPDNLASNDIITISKIESKMFENGGSQYKITSTTNKKFKLNDTLKAGGETVAYKQFKDMGIKVGSTVEVRYNSIPKDYQGTPYTDNMITSFREAAGRPQTTQPAKTEPSYHTTNTELKDEKFWDKKAYKQCLWNYWLENLGSRVLNEEDCNLVWQVFNQIEKDATKRYAVGWDKAVKTFADEPLPEETPEVDAIPY